MNEAPHAPRTRPSVAIVGCGRVGLREHLPGVRAAGGDVVALVDTQPGLAAAAAREHGVPRAFEDLGALLRDARPEVVAVCTPSAAHRDVALAALDAGCHLYLEKPPTVSAGQMQDVAARARERRACVLAGSHHPYRENVRHLRDRIAAGDLGEIYALECRKLRRAACPPDRGTETHPQGVAFFSSVHRLDVALFLLGNPPVHAVSARTWTHFSVAAARAAGVHTPSGLVEDAVLALVHFGNGCSLSLADIHAAHAEEPNDMQCWFGDFRVLGTRRGARLHPLALFETRGDGGVLVEEPAVNNDLHAGHAPAYRFLFDHVRRGTPPEGTLERAVATMRLVDAIHASARDGGRTVTLSLP